MKSQSYNVQFRNAIKDKTLRIMLDSLWDYAENQLHPFQKGLTDAGFHHCLRVETNIWSLIHENIHKFKPWDLFILSASAALHDIGKIQTQGADDKIDHGEMAKKWLLEANHWRGCFRNRMEAEAVAHVIGVHRNGRISQLPEEEFVIGNPPGVLLRSLAAIFRLADMLDSDYRRCPYLVKSLRKLHFSKGIEKIWVARSSIRGWKISDDGKTIFLQASPRDEKAKISTLAYVDLLNTDLTKSHRKYLENCRVVYWDESELKEDTLHFPFHFSFAEFEKGVLKDRGGLIELYTETAKQHTSGIAAAFSNVDLKGIGAFKEKGKTMLSKVFIDINVTLASGLAPQNYNMFDKEVIPEIRNSVINNSVPVTKIVRIPKLQKVVILGDPGSGKTTVSRFLCLNCQTNANLEGAKNTQRYGIAGIPFHITVRDFASERERNPRLTLLGYIDNQVSLFLGHPPPFGYVEFWLSKENSLIFFDGLDEVTRLEERKQIRDLVMIFTRDYVGGKVFVTSRKVGYEDAPLDRNSFLHLVLTDLESPHVEAFVKNWYAEKEPNPSERKSAIESFLEALNDEHVADLARNPLLLTIMVLVHRAEADLPKQRAKLYNKCVEAFMVTRDRARDLLSYDEDEIRACHEFLGYWIHSRAEHFEGGSSVSLEVLKKSLLDDLTKRHQDLKIPLERKVEEFIDYARRRVGLIAERGQGLFAFGHRSFQEYFAARYISQNTFGKESLWFAVHDKIDRTHWVEPLKLLAGIYGFSNRKELNVLVEKILEDSKVSDPGYKKLILAGEIAGDKVPLSRDTLFQIADAIVQQFLSARDMAIMNNCKRVLEHFYNTRLWDYLVEKLRSIDIRLYSDSAFYYFHQARQFGDTKLDRVLATL